MKRFYRKGLVLAAAAAVLALAGTSWAATLVVGPGETYTTIKSAVLAAAAGDVIEVREGTYDEDVVISTNNLTLTSVDGPGLAVVRGINAESGVFTIDSDLGVSIDGFTILPGAGNSDGIHHKGGSPTTPVTITNNTMEGFSDHGFYAGSWSYLTGTTFTFTGNTMRECYTGIYVYGFDGSTIRINNNTVIDCEYGMDLEEFDEGMGTDAQVMGNTITLDESLSGSEGLALCCMEDTTTISGNVVTGPYKYGMYVDYVGCCGKEPAVVFVEGNRVTGADYGLYFYDAAYLPAELSVRDNIVTGNDYGIYIDEFTEASDPESSVQFTNNNLADNSLYGFYNETSDLADAKGNWWGDASGPFDDKTLPGTPDYNNPAGTGSRVSEYVDYDPWLTEAPKPAAPVLLSPADGAADVSVTVALETEPFVTGLPVTHKATVWQAATASDFSSGVVIDEESTTSLTSYAVPDGTLDYGTTYYWRARFRDSDDTLTEWSATWSFTTEAEPGPTPSGGGGGGCSTPGFIPSALLLALPVLLLKRR